MMGDLSSAGMDSEALDEVTIPCTMEIYEEDLLPAKISFDILVVKRTIFVWL